MRTGLTKRNDVKSLVYKKDPSAPALMVSVGYVLKTSLDTRETRADDNGNERTWGQVQWIGLAVEMERSDAFAYEVMARDFPAPGNPRITMNTGYDDRERIFQTAESPVKQSNQQTGQFVSRSTGCG